MHTKREQLETKDTHCFCFGAMTYNGKDAIKARNEAAQWLENVCQVRPRLQRVEQFDWDESGAQYEDGPIYY